MEEQAAESRSGLDDDGGRESSVNQEMIRVNGSNRLLLSLCPIF